MKFINWLILALIMLSALVTMLEAYLDKWFFAFWWLGLTIIWAVNFAKGRELEYLERDIRILHNRIVKLRSTDWSKVNYI